MGDKNEELRLPSLMDNRNRTRILDNTMIFDNSDQHKNVSLGAIGKETGYLRAHH
jgi:hypothetical protein